MKRTMFGVIVLSLTVACACQPKQTSNGNANNTNVNINANLSIRPLALNAKEKVVQIIITYDQGTGNYIIDDPCCVRISKGKKQKIVWCIVYEGTGDPPTSVTIDTFRDPSVSTNKNPFGDGSDPKNKFDIPFNKFDCQEKTEDAASGVKGVSYKYNIAAKVNGVTKGFSDPMVIIID